jgi:hypothetical protein
VFASPVCCILVDLSWTQPMSLYEGSPELRRPLQGMANRGKHIPGIQWSPEVHKAGELGVRG